MLRVWVVALGCFGVADAILDGRTINESEWKVSPLRSILSDGGGSAEILFVDGDEAVVFTAGHTPQTNVPSSFKWSAGPVDPTGAGNPGTVPFTLETIDFFKYWTIDDIGNCAKYNKEGWKSVGGNTSKLQCAAIARAGGCDGSDISIYRMKITAAAQAMAPWPSLPLALDHVPSVNETVQNSGYGIRVQCDDGGGPQQGGYGLLNTGQVTVSRLYANQLWTYGSKFDADGPASSAFLPKGVSVDCAGDSGGPLFVPGHSSGIFAVNSQGDDGDPSCAAKKQDAVCAWVMASASWVYPQRKWLRDVLTAWKPAWAAHAQYTCEPIGEAGGSCAAGCKACPGVDNDATSELAPHGDCYPEGAACPHSSGDGQCCTCDDGAACPCGGDPCFADQSGTIDEGVKLCKGNKDKKQLCRRWSVSAANSVGGTGPLGNGGVLHKCEAPGADGTCALGFSHCAKLWERFPTDRKYTRARAGNPGLGVGHNGLLKVRPYQK